MSLVTMEHLTKSYTERLLFDDTAFGMEEGEKVGRTHSSVLGSSRYAQQQQ